MKSAKIYYDTALAGRLMENEEGFFFEYDTQYLNLPDARFTKVMPQWEITLSNSFLPPEAQASYWQLIQQRFCFLQS